MPNNLTSGPVYCMLSVFMQGALEVLSQVGSDVLYQDGLCCSCCCLVWRLASLTTGLAVAWSMDGDGSSRTR